MFRSYGGGEREALLEVLRSRLAGEVPTSAVKARREELGMSQHDLARASGVSQPVISRIEAGGRLPTNAQAGKLGVALKMGRDDLGLEESLSLMRRLAVKGKLPSEAAVDVALHLLETQPTSEAGRRLNDAALAALVEIAETAARGSQDRIANPRHA